MNQHTISIDSQNRRERASFTSRLLSLDMWKQFSSMEDRLNPFSYTSHRNNNNELNETIKFENTQDIRDSDQENGSEEMDEKP